MSKQINWGNPPQTNTTFANQLVKAQGQAENQASMEKRWQVLKPYLKKALVESIQYGQEIEVKRPIAYFTEVMQVRKGMESASAIAQTVKKVIPKGSKIVCKSWVPALKQFIFENVTTGEEYEIYPYDMLHTGDPTNPVMPNTAWIGLMQNTNIYDDLMAKLNEKA